MKVRFIDDSNENNLLLEKDNCNDLSPYLKEFGQIKIATEKQVLICSYEYHVIDANNDEIDIIVRISDTEEKSEQ